MGNCTVCAENEERAKRQRLLLMQQSREYQQLQAPPGEVTEDYSNTEMKSSLSTRTNKVDLSIFNNPKRECEDIKDCVCVKRAVCALQLELMKSNEPEFIVKFCEEKYKFILDDYIHILCTHNNSHDLDFIYHNMTDRKQVCDIKQCEHSNRYHRDRRTDRINLNSTTKETNLHFTFYKDIMAQCHCYLFHLYDMALRSESLSLSAENMHDTDGLTDIMFRNMCKTLNETIKRNKLDINNEKYLILNNNLTEKDTFLDNVLIYMKSKDISAKVIASFDEFIENEEFDTESINDDITHQNSQILNHFETQNHRNAFEAVRKYCRIVELHKHTFSPGYIFYYWEHYKHPALKREQWWVNRNDHNGYTENELYIPRKYPNLKEEMLDNKLYHLSREALSISQTKIEKYMHTLSIKAITSLCPAGLYYGMEKGLTLSRDHLLCLVLYTDWTDLCTAFSRTFRSNTSYETLQSIKSRNREFANLSRLLRETVECYGKRGYEGDLNDSTDQLENRENKRVQGPFFCGMSMVFVFPEFNIRLCGPTSTSKAVEVALRFSDSNGIIMQLNNYGYESCCELRSFDCSWISNYAGEDERLFMGGHYCVKIESITHVGTNQNFEKFCEPLFYFDCCIKGMALEEEEVNVRSKHCSLLNNLCEYSLDQSFAQMKQPQYIHDTFECFCNHKQSIVLNLQTINGALKKLKDLILSDGNILKPIIFKLFGNCKDIIIYTTDSYGKEFKFNLFSFLSVISAPNVFSVCGGVTMTVIGKWDYFDQNKCSWIRNQFTSSMKEQFTERGYSAQLHVKEEGRYTDNFKKEDRLIIKQNKK